MMHTGREVNLSSFNSTVSQSDVDNNNLNVYEVSIMVLMTGLTNLVIVPTIMIMFKQKMMFQFFLAIFTLITSFMYHILDSLKVEKYFLLEEDWHKLGIIYSILLYNIGTIVLFMVLFGYMADLKNLSLETNINYIGLFITMIAQESSPWDIYFTVVPIVTWGLIYLILKGIKKEIPELNPAKMKLGSLFFFLALFCFYYGLDEERDYLRIFHGLWHISASFFSFQWWQVKLKEQDCYTLKELWSKPRLNNCYYCPFDSESNSLENVDIVDIVTNVDIVNKS